MVPAFKESGQRDSMEALSGVPCSYCTNASSYAIDGILHTVVACGSC